MIVRTLLVGFLFAVAMSLSPLSAAPALQLSLRDAIERVLEKNPNFRVYQLRRQALDGEYQTANLDPAWQVNTEIEKFLGTGELGDLKGSEWTLTLGRVIERGNKRGARSSVVRQRQAMIDAEQQILELDLLSRTASRLIDVASAQTRLEILQRSVDIAASVLDAVNARINAGRSPEAERSRAIAALGEAELKVQSAQFAIESARYRLAALWGSAEPEFTTVAANLLQVEPPGEIQELIEGLKRSPAISAYTTEARLREAQLSLARAKQAADFSIGGGIKHAADINETALVAEFSMPLQARQRSRGAMTTAQANLLRVESEQDAALYKMQGQLLALDQQRQEAANRFDVLQNRIIPQLQQAFDQTRQAYESGLYGYLELGAAQRDLLDAELELVAAASQAHQLRIEIERLSGHRYGGSTTGGNQ